MSDRASARLIPAIVATFLFVLLALWPVAAADCTKTSVGLIPIIDLWNGYYRGEQGGLYADGINTRPALHEEAGIRLAQQIQPVDGNGFPDPAGKIVFVTIGGSTTEMIGKYFKLTADSAPDKNPAVLVFNGARQSARAEKWAFVNHAVWGELKSKLSLVGVTPAQLQVAWVKSADQDTVEGFEVEIETLRQRITKIAQNLKFHFPNIKIAYFTSRMYGGYANIVSPGSPEPHAYETGYGIKLAILDQINGSPELTYDSAAGAGKAPWMAWGPYVWADGVKPRSDGLFYVCSDFKSDGEHPKTGARRKVTDSLMKFLRSDTTARPWFVQP